jgi:hypothetical protein
MDISVVGVMMMGMIMDININMMKRKWKKIMDIIVMDMIMDMGMVMVKKLTMKRKWKIIMIMSVTIIMIIRIVKRRRTTMITGIMRMKLLL